MARGINRVTLIGNLGKDPELKTFADGGAVANTSLATTESWKGKDGQQQEHTEWHNLVFNGKLADIANEYLRKGSKIYVEGSIRTRKYQDKEGKEARFMEIRVSEMRMLDGKPGSGDEREQPRRAQQAPPQSAGHQGGGGFDGPDDDIPFAPIGRRHALAL